MKKLTLLLIPLLLLSSCSIDWNDEKDTKIAELEKQIQDDTFKKNVECNDYFEKNKERIFGSQQDMIQSGYQVLSIGYSRTLSSCYIGFKRENIKEQTNQYIIDNPLTKEDVFNSLIVPWGKEDSLARESFNKKIKELK